MTRILVLLVGFLLTAGLEQSPGQSKTHGTVNILLANRNGLVLVTDSRLSNQVQSPVGSAPKLFVLDDHTVCSIADFYSDSGPLIHGSASAFTNVPGILRDLLEMHSTDVKNNRPVHLFFDDLIDIYTFSLTALANLDSVEDARHKPSGAQLTIAGYESERLHVLQVRLEPEWYLNAWRYIQRERLDRIVTDGVLTRFAGITNTVDAILANPTDRSVIADPILSYFTSEIARNNGSDLTLEDLRQAAVQLKEWTSRQYPRVVGGKTQFVTMKDGHIFSQELLTSGPAEQLGTMKLLQVYGVGLVGSPSHPINIFPAPPPGGALGYLYVDTGFTELTERLDGKAYIRSHFENCILQYTGNGPVLFDANNTVSNTTLEVGRNVQKNDEFLVEIQKKFPSLKIVQVADF